MSLNPNTINQNIVDPDEVAYNEPWPISSGSTLFIKVSVIGLDDFATVGVSKFKAGRVHFGNSGEKVDWRLCLTKKLNWRGQYQLNIF